MADGGWRPSVRPLLHSLFALLLCFNDVGREGFIFTSVEGRRSMGPN